MITPHVRPTRSADLEHTTRSSRKGGKGERKEITNQRTTQLMKERNMSVFQGSFIIPKRKISSRHSAVQQGVRQLDHLRDRARQKRRRRTFTRHLLQEREENDRVSWVKKKSISNLRDSLNTEVWRYDVREGTPNPNSSQGRKDNLGHTYARTGRRTAIIDGRFTRKEEGYEEMDHWRLEGRKIEKKIQMYVCFSPTFKKCKLGCMQQEKKTQVSFQWTFHSFRQARWCTHTCR